MGSRPGLEVASVGPAWRAVDMASRRGLGLAASGGGSACRGHAEPSRAAEAERRRRHAVRRRVVERAELGADGGGVVPDARPGHTDDPVPGERELEVPALVCFACEPGAAPRIVVDIDQESPILEGCVDLVAEEDPVARGAGRPFATHSAANASSSSLLVWRVSIPPRVRTRRRRRRPRVNAVPVEEDEHAGPVDAALPFRLIAHGRELRVGEARAEVEQCSGNGRRRNATDVGDLVRPPVSRPVNDNPRQGPPRPRGDGHMPPSACVGADPVERRRAPIAQRCAGAARQHDDHALAIDGQDAAADRVDASAPGMQRAARPPALDPSPGEAEADELPCATTPCWRAARSAILRSICASASMPSSRRSGRRVRPHDTSHPSGGLGRLVML